MKAIYHYSKLIYQLSKVWEEQIERTLNSNPNGKSKYVLLRSNQLVGAALIIFVKSNIVESIRNVETSVKKVYKKTSFAWRHEFHS